MGEVFPLFSPLIIFLCIGKFGDMLLKKADTRLEMCLVAYNYDRLAREQCFRLQIAPHITAFPRHPLSPTLNCNCFLFIAPYGSREKELAFGHYGRSGFNHIIEFRISIGFATSSSACFLRNPTSTFKDTVYTDYRETRQEV